MQFFTWWTLNNSVEYILDFDCIEHQTNPISVRVTVRSRSGFDPNCVKDNPSGCNLSNLTIINTTKSLASDFKSQLHFTFECSISKEQIFYYQGRRCWFNNIDIFAITKTWLQTDISNQVTVNNICPTGYILYQLLRTGSRGGGVALLYWNRFKLKILSSGLLCDSFEFTDC